MSKRFVSKSERFMSKSSTSESFISKRFMGERFSSSAGMGPPTPSMRERSGR